MFQRPLVGPLLHHHLEFRTSSGSDQPRHQVALRLQYVLIEDAGSGHSLYQALKHRTRLHVIRLHVIPIGPQGDKQERAVEVTPEIEAARVFLPKEAGL